MRSGSGLVGLALILMEQAAIAASPTADSILASLQAQTSLQSINARTSCATPESRRDPNAIIICGRRETSRYRYGQRGQPYSSKFKGMTPQQVADALAGVHHYRPMAGERAYHQFNSMDIASTRHAAMSGGLGRILDPLGLGFRTMKSRDIYFGLQEDVE
jgi:hypothetical protein